MALDLTWDQAQFSFRFVITFWRARRNENSGPKSLKTLFCIFKKVPFTHFWEHRFQLQKRYLFVPFRRTSLETEKKVPLLSFKTSFGKVRNGWRADNIDVKISFTRKLKIPDFFFNKRYLFLTFILNDKHRQKRYQFCILSYGEWTHNLVFLLVLTSRVDLFVKK